MSRSRLSTVPRVCNVESRRCPVKLACTAIPAVSRSRISPTRMASGSSRRAARKAHRRDDLGGEDKKKDQARGLVLFRQSWLGLVEARHAATKAAAGESAAAEGTGSTNATVEASRAAEAAARAAEAAAAAHLGHQGVHFAH